MLVNGGELVDIVDDFHRAWDAFGEMFDVIEHFGGGGNRTERFEGVGAGRTIA